MNSVRYHRTRIGEGVRGEARKDVTAPGVLTFSVVLFGDVDIEDSAELSQLAYHARAAAQWLETHR